LPRQQCKVTANTRVGSFDSDVHSTEQATHGGSAWHVWIDLVISQILGKTTMVGVASQLDGRRWRATRSSEMVRLPGSVTIFCIQRSCGCECEKDVKDDPKLEPLRVLRLSRLQRAVSSIWRNTKFSTLKLECTNSRAKRYLFSSISALSSFRHRCIKVKTGQMCAAAQLHPKTADIRRLFGKWLEFIRPIITNSEPPRVLFF